LELYHDDLLKVVGILDFSVVSQEVQNLSEIEDRIRKRIHEYLFTGLTRTMTNELESGGKIGIDHIGDIQVRGKTATSQQTSSVAPDSLEGIITAYLTQVNSLLLIIFVNVSNKDIDPFSSLANKILSARAESHHKIVIVVVPNSLDDSGEYTDDWKIYNPIEEINHHILDIYNGLSQNERDLIKYDAYKKMMDLSHGSMVKLRDIYLVFQKERLTKINTETISNLEQKLIEL
jgi:hypothetical protein